VETTCKVDHSNS